MDRQECANNNDHFCFCLLFYFFFFFKKKEEEKMSSFHAVNNGVIELGKIPNQKTIDNKCSEKNRQM